MEQLNRRRFLGAAAGTGAAATFGAIAPAAMGKNRGRSSDSDSGHGHGRGGSVPRDRRSIQLYSLREKMKNQSQARDMLRFLGKVGYTEVETAGHYDWTAAQFRSELRRAGLRASSGHDGFDVDPENTAWQEDYKATLEYAAELGQKYTGLAYQRLGDTEAVYKHLAARFNEAGELARSFGLQFFYHNHDFEFSNKQSDGETPLYDILLNETDKDLVKFELDLYWIVYGGENPLAYLSADPARYPLYHVKDRTWKDRGPDVQDWEDVGPGAIDFPDIFVAGEGRRLDKFFIIEHDAPWLSHPDDTEAEYKTALAGIDYLKKVRW